MNEARWENPDILAVLLCLLHGGWILLPSPGNSASTVLYFCVVFLNKKGQRLSSPLARYAHSFLLMGIEI